MDISIITLLTILIAILMNDLFITLPIILIVILIFFLVRYIKKLPERRKNREILNRTLLLYNEKIKAEQAKQFARSAGENIRNNITNIAKHK